MGAVPGVTRPASAEAAGRTAGTQLPSREGAPGVAISLTAKIAAGRPG